MIDRIDKQDSLVRRIVDGSVTIDSGKEFEKLFKVFPKDPYLHRVFADLLKQNKSFEAAADAYESATQLFIEADLTLQAIVAKILEWRIFRPSDQEGQAFYLSLREGCSKDTALQRFLIKMTYPEMIAFMFALIPRLFSVGSMVKRFGDEEASLYFVVSGALEETTYHRLVTEGWIQKKSSKDLVENDFFGEIYPFEEEKLSRSDIETITRVELVEITKSKLMTICRKYPNIKPLINDLYEARSESDKEGFSTTVRRTVRHQLPIQINLKIYQDQPDKAPMEFTGFTENISLGGARVVLSAKKYQTGPADYLTGKKVKIKIGLPTASGRLSILGTTVWSKEVYIEGKATPVLGIQFQQMTETDRRLLEDYYYGSEGEQNLIWSLWDSLMEKQL